MMSRNLKRFAASNGTAALVLTCMILGSGFTAGAQSEGAQSEDARSHKCLQGTWRVQVTIRDLSHGRGPEDLPSAVCLR
jgi:hypothetical protein